MKLTYSITKSVYNYSKIDSFYKYSTIHYPLFNVVNVLTAN